MQVRVNDVTCEVESSATVKTLKKIVKEIKKVPRRYQILKFNNEMLKDSETLSYYGIENQSILNLLIRKGKIIRIFVHTMDEKKLKLDISNMESVGAVKQKIYKNIGTPVEIQKLLLNKKNLEHDLATLSYYHITNDSNLYLV